MMNQKHKTESRWEQPVTPDPHLSTATQGTTHNEKHSLGATFQGRGETTKEADYYRSLASETRYNTPGFRPMPFFQPYMPYPYYGYPSGYRYAPCSGWDSFQGEMMGMPQMGGRAGYRNFPSGMYGQGERYTPGPGWPATQGTGYSAGSTRMHVPGEPRHASPGPAGGFGPLPEHQWGDKGQWPQPSSVHGQTEHWEKPADEDRPWLMDEEVEQRRDYDRTMQDLRERQQEIPGYIRGGFAPVHHRGKGPKNYRRPDNRIMEDVSDRMTDDSWLDASGIEVHVHHGEVILNGSVENRESKRRAEDIAECVSGVMHVQNNLRVRMEQPVSTTPVSAVPRHEEAAKAMTPAATGAGIQVPRFVQAHSGGLAAASAKKDEP